MGVFGNRMGAGVNRPIAVLLLAPAVLWAADHVPLGHRDFYPSPERPIGFRGDGTGAFPGATPVTEWREGTPTMGRTRTLAGQQARVRLLLADRKAENIAWKTEMPGFSNSQPIVVGDRVITTAEPSSLVCLDVHTGKILWIRENNPFDIMGLPEKEADALTTYMAQLYAVIATFRSLVGNYTRLPEKATAADRALWLKHMRWAEQVLLAMAKGPYVQRVQESLRRMDKILADFHALTAGDSSGHLDGPMQAMAGAATTWIHDSYTFYPCSHWDGFIGWTFPTPVSDGEFIYASMGQGQIVCYDLTGRRIWARFFRNVHAGARAGTPGCNMGHEHCPSPRLIGDVLVAQVTVLPKHYDGLHGLDKRTGEVLWSTRDVTNRTRSHNHVAIPLPDGGVLDVLACANGKILRARDGKLLCGTGEPGTHGPNAGGCTDVVSGNRWFFMGKSGVVAYELTAFSEDKVEARRLWEAPLTHVNSTAVLSGDYLYRLNGSGHIVDVRHGALVRANGKKPADFTIRPAYPSPILAGKYLIRVAGGQRTKPFAVNSQVLELAEAGKPRLIAETNLLDGDPIPRMPRLETHIPGYEPGDLWGKCGATPTQFAHSSMCAQANRLFFRSIGHLYCIGDPKAPYDWNPASRPRRITAKLEAAAKALATRDPVDALSSPYAWDRKAGRQAIVALPAEQQKAVLDRVAKLTASEGWRALRAAAATLRDSGPAAASALPELQEALEKWLAAKHLNRATEVLAAIQKIDPTAQKTIVPSLVKAIDSGDSRAVRAACRLIVRIGMDAEPTVPGLVGVLESRDDNLTGESALALQHVGIDDPDTVPALAAALKRKDRWLVIAALDALGLRAKAAAPAAAEVAKCLKRDDLRVVLHAADVLLGMGPGAGAAAPALYEALKHEDSRVVCAAAETLFRLEPADEKTLTLTMAKHLSSDDNACVLGNARAFGIVGPELKTSPARLDAVEALLKVLRTRTPKLKREAAKALGRFGDKARSAVPALREAALGPDCPDHAKAALKKIAPAMDVEKLEPAMDVEKLEPEVDDDLNLNL